MSLNKKLLGHIIAISLFIFGTVVLHTIINKIELEYNFFWIRLNFTTVFDMSLLSIGISFFIEFYLSFNQINIIKNSEEK
ncbi:MAG: hypothetical protein ACOC1X_00015 [Promethearchaeota archaeon]